MLEKRSTKLEWRDGLEGFQAAIHPGGYMGGIYSARDFRAFHTTLVVQCRVPEQANSRLGYHAYRRLCSFRFACKADGKINSNDIYL
jgi:hypothetical protein